MKSRRPVNSDFIRLFILMEPENESYTINVHEAPFRSLAYIAGRIGALLETSTATSNAELFSALDDFVGAVYALVFAWRGGFKERRDETPELKPPRTRARQLEQGHVRIDGVWMAGFHFNSALYRIAAVYHRVLKLVASPDALQKNKQPMVGNLLPDIESRFPNWTHQNLTDVYREVNLLKHERGGIHDTRLVTFDQALSATEELLNLLEAWIAGTSKSTVAVVNAAG